MTAPSDETSPLLNGSISSASVTHTARDAAYARFSPAQKRVIVMLVSCSSLLPMFASGSFIPAMPQIARDLDSTGPVISYAVSLSIFGAALGGMIFATYSSYYGRRPVYLFGLPLLCLGSLGVSRSSTIPALMCFRFIQAFGTSGGISVGGGVIGDVYPLTERGSALGIFFAASLVGNAIAPIVGGWGARYSSWRNVQLGILALGLAVFLGMLFFLPETAHPGSRGIEKDKASSGNDTGKWVWLNPFSCLWLLRSPNIMFVTLTSLTVLYTDYALLVPIAYTVGKSYNITNEAIIGACFFPMGLGNLIGAPLAGWISDRVLIRARRLRRGVWVPEDRLLAALSAGYTFVPLSVLFAGVCLQFIPGTPGLVLTLLCFFFNGLGVDLVLSPGTAYLVDVLHSRSAEVMAGSIGLRSLLLSLAISGVLPSIETMGMAGFYCLVAALAWLGAILLHVTIRKGDKMRAWLNIGFSTVDTT